MLDGRSRRVTSADVARAAGLSRATVSYVLNDTPGQKIPQATRQRVLDAAAQLGYAPSAAARALRSGRSDIVLCLLPDWPIGATVGAFLEHLSAALAAEGLAFEEFEDDEARAMRAAGTEVSVALLGGSRRRPGEFGIPQQRVGRLQAEHLAAKAHRRLGFAAPDDPRVRAFAEPRLDGVRHACAELGLPEPDVRTVPLDPAGAAEGD